ncbi:hypothetical protein LCGC14_2719220 [marine sediment metagenome]|uniref:Uncharacterized protein n=1 Tax=marine sediment metagenome TaxID=412755 RepID=A0A0F9C2B8_9ZZZZ
MAEKSIAEIRAMLRELGRVRREVGKRELRRRQVKQILNALGYLLVLAAVVFVALNL